MNRFTVFWLCGLLFFPGLWGQGMAAAATPDAWKPVFDSLVARYTGPSPDYFSQISPSIVRFDSTATFYFLLFLSLYLGLLRQAYPRFLPALLRAYRGGAGGARFGKEDPSSTLPAMLMNLLFVLVAAAFIVQSIRGFAPHWVADEKLGQAYLFFSLGILLVYLVKFLFLRFSGWVFQVQTLTRHYLYQVFLANKSMTLILLPASFGLAFAQPGLRAPIFWLSISLVCLLVINRYTRSWQVMAPLVRRNRFHFFTYLCASEILPTAVILKLLFLSLSFL